MCMLFHTASQGFGYGARDDHAPLCHAIRRAEDATFALPRNMWTFANPAAKVPNDTLLLGMVEGLLHIRQSLEVCSETCFDMGSRRMFKAWISFCICLDRLKIHKSCVIMSSLAPALLMPNLAPTIPLRLGAGLEVSGSAFGPA